MDTKEQIISKISETPETEFKTKFLNEQTQSISGWRDFSEDEGGLYKLLHFRRLDSLAILFEYITSCAGIVLVQDKLIFAANKITVTSFKREHLNEIIKRTMGYFSLLAKVKLQGGTHHNLSSQREEIFRMLCSHERILSIKKPSKKGGEELKINIKQADVSSMVSSILKKKDLPSGSALLHEHGYGVDKAIIYYITLGLYRNFTR